MASVSIGDNVQQQQQQQQQQQGSDTIVTILEHDNNTSDHESRLEAMDDHEFRVLTLNCWGLPVVSKDYAKRIDAIGTELSKGKFCIVCLQEVWVKADYYKIKSLVKDCFPYSHYFYSGFIGSGICIFSRYPITNAFFHKFPVNGYFYALTHGDFFGGKGVGFCELQHPERVIKVFSTHLHAEYSSNDYSHLRTLQAFHISQFVKLVSNPTDCVLLCGDLNLQETELGFRTIKELTGLQDAWYSCVQKSSHHGSTVNVADNPYTDVKDQPEMRIDFVLHSPNLQSLDCGLTIEQVPDTSMHFSDHKGVQSLFGMIETPKTCHSPSPVSRELLEELRLSMTTAIESLERYSVRKAIIFWVVLLFFIFMPIISADIFHAIFPQVETHVGKFIFLLQVVAVVLCVGVFWTSIIDKKTEKSAFINIKNEVELKLAALKTD